MPTYNEHSFDELSNSKRLYSPSTNLARGRNLKFEKGNIRLMRDHAYIEARLKYLMAGSDSFEEKNSMLSS